MTVIDTDVLVDAMRGREGAIRFLDGLLLGTQPVAVSSVTVMQLHEGIARSRSREREGERVKAALLGVVTYPFTKDIAERAGTLQGQFHRRGRPISHTDLMIAATALHHGEPLATRNRRDFERVPGLGVISP